jgi:hypothetical protein
MIKRFVLLFAGTIAAGSAQAQSPIVDDGFVITYTPSDNPKIDSLRSQIDSLTNRLEQMRKELLELELPHTDLDPLNPNRNLDNIPPYRLEIPDDLWPGKRPQPFDFQVEPPDLKKFNIPWLPQQHEELPEPESTPVPDFPGWRVQWLGAKTT